MWDQRVPVREKSRTGRWWLMWGRKPEKTGRTGKTKGALLMRTPRGCDCCLAAEAVAIATAA